MSYPLFDENGNRKVRRGQQVLGCHLADGFCTASEAIKGYLDPEQRIVDVICSSDNQDRDGDRIDQNGITYANWGKKHEGPVLYAHDYGTKYLPIGVILKHWIETVESKGRIYKVTRERHQFNPAGTYELSDAAWKLVEFGSLNATSIGFISKRMTRPTSEEERKRLDLGPHGVLFNEIEKLETSWCPVQSNRDAIRNAFGKGIISRCEAQILFPNRWHEVNAPKHWVVGIDFLRDPASSFDNLGQVSTKTIQTLVNLLNQLKTGFQNLKEILAERERLQGR